MIRSQCAVRHLISCCLPRRQLSCVIFISIFYTPSISKRDAGQSFTSLIVCLHSDCAFSSFHGSHLPGNLPAGRQGRGAGNYSDMLLQRPISKTSTLRAAVLVGFPVWLREGWRRPTPHLSCVCREGVVWREGCYIWHQTGPIFV